MTKSYPTILVLGATGQLGKIGRPGMTLKGWSEMHKEELLAIAD